MPPLTVDQAPPYRVGQVSIHAAAVGYLGYRGPKPDLSSAS